MTPGRAGAAAPVLFQALWASLVVCGSGCSGEVAAPRFGTLEVNVRTSGSGSDPDGFRFAVDGAGATPVGQSEASAFLTVSTGSHQVALSGVAPNCSLQGDPFRSTMIAPGDTTEVGFEVSCETSAGEVQITTASGGSDIDPNGYVVSVDGAPRFNFEPTESVTHTLPAGSHQIALGGLTPNCAVNGGTDRVIDVSSGRSVRVDFEITCAPAPPAGHWNELVFVRLTPSPNPFAEPIGALYVMNSDGTGVRQLLPDSPRNQVDPDWSPDGDRLTFAADNLTLQFDLYVLGLGSASPVKLDLPGFFTKRDPHWLRDGNEIVFTHDDPTVTADFNVLSLVVIDQDGSSPTPLTIFPAGFNQTRRPAPSPDGSSLAFESSAVTYGPNGECCFRTPPAIYVADTDGSGPRLLVTGADSAIHPAWSPDGAKIAYSSGGDIFIVPVEGGEPSVFTEGPENDDHPAWSPDGSRIAFSREQNGNPEIYVMDVSGDNLTRLTNHPDLDTSPAWRP